ncbi:hypothetical protein CLV47_12335 [Antricoccus suffuscus]|uniref:Uncharacterized protein n=1 Tax=Antricoccus suffuscus TaxID=1629062 RepID=A0A2T0ZEN3_9ACTN|nr:hypothetical protein [Antricoccus suffuscus]PRZ34803.1 hypothetical protein CLV47_12335 [Antricoccus suffuscus]
MTAVLQQPRTQTISSVDDAEAAYRALEPVADPTRRHGEPWHGLSAWAADALERVAQDPQLRRDARGRARISYALYAQVIDGILLTARSNGALRVGIDVIQAYAGTSRDAVKEALRVLTAGGLARRAFRGRPKTMDEHEVIQAAGKKTFRWVSIWVLTHPAENEPATVDNQSSPPPSGGRDFWKNSYVTLNSTTWMKCATRKEEGASRQQPPKNPKNRRARRSYTPAVNALYARLRAGNSLFQVSTPGRLKSALSRFAAAGCTPADILRGLNIAKARLGWTTPDGRVRYADRWLCKLLKELDPHELRSRDDLDQHARDDHWIAQHIDGDSPTCPHGKPAGSQILPSGRTYCWQCDNKF